MHCSLKSIPTLSNFHSLAPQGCFFFILIISPTLNSIFPLLSLFSINLPVKFTIAENIFYVKVFFFFLFSLFLSYSIFFYLTYFIPFFISSAIWATLSCSSIISFTVSARAFLKNDFCFLLLYFLYILPHSARIIYTRRSLRIQKCIHIYYTLLQLLFAT